MIVSGIVGLSSVLLYTYLPDLLSSLISSQLVLKDGDNSPLFEIFVKTPVAIDYAYYFYQINNPSEVLRGFKPRVSKVGPFCFKQYRTKKIVGWGDNGETVKYLEYKSNVFSTEGEGCKSSLDEKITVINPPIAALGATIADIVREKVPLTGVSSPIIMSAMSAFLAAHSQNMFMTRSARDILLGFRVNLLDTVTTLIRPLEMLGFRKEDLLPGGGVPNNTFGLMYGKNNTPEGPYEVYTGKNSHYKFIHVAKYKNTGSLSFWKSQFCNQIRGSDGSMFGAGVKRSDKLWAFAADICRSIYLSYTRDGEYKGIPTYVFGIDDTLFGNTVVEPKNECFCVHPESVKHRCAISGIFDIGACQGGAPLIVSKPEYLSTDPDLSQGIEGFAPNKEDHDSVVEVEPLTGIAVNGIKKLQFSLRVENVPFLRGFNNMKNVTYIPFAMAEEKGGLPEDMADMLRNFVFNPLKFIYWGLLGTAGVAAFLTGRSGIRRLMRNQQTRNSVKQIKNSAKNIYKKRNAVDSEISSIKSKNSMTELIPKSNNYDNYANTTNVKLHLKNNDHSQSNRFQQLSASRLMQPFYANGQAMMQSYFPQVIPILMPIPYTMNQTSTENNRNDEINQQRLNNPVSMITNLNSYTASIENDSIPIRRTSNIMSYNLVNQNLRYSNSTFDHHDSSNASRNNSIKYPNIYPNIQSPVIRGRTSVLKRSINKTKSSNDNQLNESNNQPNQNELNNRLSEHINEIKLNQNKSIHSSDKLNRTQENKIESAINEIEDNKIENNDIAEIRTNSSVSIEENVDHYEYNNLDDQFYYYNREHLDEPTLNNEQITLNNLTNQTNLNDQANLTNQTNLNDQANLTNQTNLNDQVANLTDDQYDGFQIADNPKVKSLNQEETNSGHGQKKNSMDEFNLTYENYRKIKKLGYDYNYY